MKGGNDRELKKVILVFLVNTLVLIMTMPNVFAQIDSYSNPTNQTSNYDVSTIYEAVGYQPLVETYSVDLSWDDLHWVFVYEGDITNPNASVWLTKEYYDSIHMTAKQIIERISDFANMDKREISVSNNSGFAINVTANVEQKSSAVYTNSAGLKITRQGNNSNYDVTANITNLTSNGSDTFIVKPTSRRFVNDSGILANVAGEVKLVFTKYN